jgi:ubiquinone/menaquinone biosynthesis C-methylase UbiE
MFPGYVISGGFQEHGERFADLVITLGKLEPDQTMLDLGCGIGRIAVPLTRYLNDAGRYEGLDIVPESIAWCQKEITSRYPNFRFQVADLYNNQYNPAGSQAASEYIFPYEDNFFDLILLKSVFTHMLPGDMKNYIGEIARTLRDGGRCMVTFFLLNEASLSAMNNGQANRQFPFVFDGYRTESDEILESAVAYDEIYIRDLLHDAGLSVEEPIHRGAWIGQERARFAHDIVVAVKSQGV